MSIEQKIRELLESKQSLTEAPMPVTTRKDTSIPVANRGDMAPIPQGGSQAAAYDTREEDEPNQGARASRTITGAPRPMNQGAGMAPNYTTVADPTSVVNMPNSTGNVQREEYDEDGETLLNEISRETMRSLQKGREQQSNELLKRARKEREKGNTAAARALGNAGFDAHHKALIAGAIEQLQGEEEARQKTLKGLTPSQRRASGSDKPLFNSLRDRKKQAIGQVASEYIKPSYEANSYEPEGNYLGEAKMPTLSSIKFDKRKFGDFTHPVSPEYTVNFRALTDEEKDAMGIHADDLRGVAELRHNKTGLQQQAMVTHDGQLIDTDQETMHDSYNPEGNYLGEASPSRAGPGVRVKTATGVTGKRETLSKRFKTPDEGQGESDQSVVYNKQIERNRAHFDTPLSVRLRAYKDNQRMPAMNVTPNLPDASNLNPFPKSDAVKNAINSGEKTIAHPNLQNHKVKIQPISDETKERLGIPDDVTHSIHVLDHTGKTIAKGAFTDDQRILGPNGEYVNDSYDPQGNYLEEQDLRSELNSIFGEDLSEEFRTKAASIFEAAVIARVNSAMDSIVEQLEEQKEQEFAELKEALVDKVDAYLSYVVEQWMQENELAIEQGLRTEISEDFIHGLKTLFQEHYIEVPEEKYDVLSHLQNTANDLHENLNAALGENVYLKQEITDLKKSVILAEMSDGLADTEIDKLHTLVEGIGFDSEDLYREKLRVIKENYFPRAPKYSPEEQILTEDAPYAQPSGAMQQYVQALSKSVKNR